MTDYGRLPPYTFLDLSYIAQRISTNKEAVDLECHTLNAAWSCTCLSESMF